MDSEFDLITRIRSRVALRSDVVLGIGDDAAVIDIPAGQQLVVTTDTLNAGVHFPHDTAVEAIGWKSLAVNLSDLASMGARPAWCTLSLSLPESSPAWLDSFLDGFLDLAGQHQVCLVGGDTTRGPLSITVTAMGLIESGSALRRDAARVGDDVWVTGTLGDASAALEAVVGGREPVAAARERLDRPTPRVAAGLQLRSKARACVDVSDGLLADLGHICERSNVGAEIALDALPFSDVLAAVSPQTRWNWQAIGGDDYELCFTAPPQMRDEILRAMDTAHTRATRIGRIVDGSDVRALDASGKKWEPQRTGFNHFC